MSPNGETAAPILGSAVTSAASLPPMSTFRGSGAVAAASGAGAPSPASLQYSHSPGAPPPAPSAPSAATNNQPTPGDTLGKALASVVSARVRVSSTNFNNCNQSFIKSHHSILSIAFFLFLIDFKRSIKKEQKLLVDVSFRSSF